MNTRIGIIGSGFAQAHINALKLCDNVTIAAICSRNEKHGGSLAQQLGAAYYPFDDHLKTCVHRPKTFQDHLKTVVHHPTTFGDNMQIVGYHQKTFVHHPKIFGDHPKTVLGTIRKRLFGI